MHVDEVVDAAKRERPSQCERTTMTNKEDENARNNKVTVVRSSRKLYTLVVTNLLARLLARLLRSRLDLLGRRLLSLTLDLLRL